MVPSASNHRRRADSPLTDRANGRQAHDRRPQPRAAQARRSPAAGGDRPDPPLRTPIGSSLRHAGQRPVDRRHVPRRPHLRRPIRLVPERARCRRVLDPVEGTRLPRLAPPGRRPGVGRQVESQVGLQPDRAGDASSTRDQEVLAPRPRRHEYRTDVRRASPREQPTVLVNAGTKEFTRSSPPADRHCSPRRQRRFNPRCRTRHRRARLSALPGDSPRPRDEGTGACDRCCDEHDWCR